MMADWGKAKSQVQQEITAKAERYEMSSKFIGNTFRPRSFTKKEIITIENKI